MELHRGSKCHVSNLQCRIQYVLAFEWEGRELWILDDCDVGLCRRNFFLRVGVPYLNLDLII